MRGSASHGAGLGLGWRTDLAVLGFGGSSITAHSDHLVVRTPSNPTYWWGNFILVTDATATDAPGHWLEVFETAFPGTAHRAIGLVAEPVDVGAWLAAELYLQRAEVFTARAPIGVTPLADGYDVRPLRTASDWKQSTRMRQAAFPGQDDFEERTTATRLAVGPATWFGAFAGGQLVAELGVVLCEDGLARYQSVLTAAEHRRRGLTRHLLGVADAHLRHQGAETAVIVADAESAAGRLYRAAGFEQETTSYQVSRVPQPQDEVS